MEEKNKFNDSITNYNNAVDKRVLLFIDEIGEKGSKGVAPLEIGEINKAHADKLRELTGKNYSGYKIIITGDTIQHIQTRHGENGKSDKSMSDPKDVARIGYVINNFDDATKEGKTSAYSNSDGTQSDIILLKKRINGNYYIAEAIPDTKKEEKIIYSKRI